MSTTTISRSRFESQRTTAGFATDAAASAVLAFNGLAEERIAAAEAVKPEMREVQLKRIAANTDGQYVLVDLADPVRGELVVEPHRPGRRVKVTLTAGELIDSLFEGADAYRDYPDDVVWRAARDWAESVGARGETLRRLNVELARVLLLRAGLGAVHPSQLPTGPQRREA
jgi:hypothetical protein